MRTGSVECETTLARDATPAIVDQLSYQRDFPVVYRAVPRDGSRKEFVRKRNDPIIALEESEIDQLRSLGYLETEQSPAPR